MSSGLCSHFLAAQMLGTSMAPHDTALPWGGCSLEVVESSLTTAQSHSAPWGGRAHCVLAAGQGGSWQSVAGPGEEWTRCVGWEGGPIGALWGEPHVRTWGTAAQAPGCWEGDEKCAELLVKHEAACQKADAVKMGHKELRSPGELVLKCIEFSSIGICSACCILAPGVLHVLLESPEPGCCSPGRIAELRLWRMSSVEVRRCYLQWCGAAAEDARAQSCPRLRVWDGGWGVKPCEVCCCVLAESLPTPLHVLQQGCAVQSYSLRTSCSFPFNRYEAFSGHNLYVQNLWEYVCASIYLST